MVSQAILVPLRRCVNEGLEGIRPPKWSANVPIVDTMSPDCWQSAPIGHLQTRETRVMKNATFLIDQTGKTAKMRPVAKPDAVASGRQFLSSCSTTSPGSIPECPTVSYPQAY